MRLLALTPGVCIEILSQNRLGHLGCVKDGQPYVVPIYYAYADDCIYSFAMAGQKIDWMRRSPLVCLQVGDVTGTRQWRSVVVTGRFEELRAHGADRQELRHAWSLLNRHANWWEPATFAVAARTAEDSPGHVFYRIGIDRLTGRQVVGDADAAAVHVARLPATERTVGASDMWWTQNNRPAACA